MHPNWRNRYLDTIRFLTAPRTGFLFLGPNQPHLYVFEPVEQFAMPQRSKF
jgi:hypothetical protein